MSPEHPDWPAHDRGQVGSVQAGIADGGSPRAPSCLIVRTRRSDHRLSAGTTYRVGRDPKSDIVLTDERVSWRHGVLRVDRDSWVLEDARSTNGTFVGVNKVERVEITAECVVRLGNPDDGPVLRCIPQAAEVAEARDRPPVPVARRGSPSMEAPSREMRHGSKLWSGRRPSAPPLSQAAQREAELAARREVDSQIAARRSAAAERQASERQASERQAAERQAAERQASERQAAERQAADRRAAERQAVPEQAAGTSPANFCRASTACTALLPLPATAMRIGRAADNDLVLSDDLGASRHHAELRKSQSGSYEIIDLGSHNGTYVNGRKTHQAMLTESDIVSVGRSTFRLVGGELRQYVDEGAVSFIAEDLVVKVSGGKVLLDNVELPDSRALPARRHRPSGAGKSTLLGALTGMRPADTGTVLYDNRDLYRDYAELRHRIGLVPQESVLHTQLTARRALQYSAELRFPADTRTSERSARVDEVMTELGLAKHANTRADQLSGGQLKRVNVAQELLTKPSLLFLDEPTSGLDPGLDKSVMEQMRDLAHDGRTVVVVTHSAANLDTCDRLLVLVPGGRIAFYGPPGEGLAYFGEPGWAEVFQAFERYPDRDWAREFAAARVREVCGGPAAPAAQTSHDTSGLPGTPPPQRRGAIRQMGTLTRRYVRVIGSDRGYLTFTGLTPAILGGLIRFFPSKEGLAGPAHTNTAAQELLLMLVICACLSGAASSVRELVKERPIYIRERRPVARRLPVLKLLVLGVISIIQSLLLVALGLVGRTMPARRRLAGRAAAGGAAARHRGALGGLDVPGPDGVRAGEHVGEGDAFPRPAHHGTGILSDGCVAERHDRPGADRLAVTVPVGVRRGGLDRQAERHHARGRQHRRPAVGAHGERLAQGHGCAQAGLAVLFSLVAWFRLRKLGPGRRR